MHGVKRLFAWMLPRFDRTRFAVSLVSLRRRDVSEETLDDLGVDITYLEKGKFDPTTLPALLRVIDRQQIDLLHLHGYGATTFGRLAAARRRLPVVVHEHANLTSTPWFQKVADRALAPFTDIAIAVSRSTAKFVTEARLIPSSRVRVVYLGAPLEEFNVRRTATEVAGIRSEIGAQPGDIVVGTVTRLHDSKGNQYLVEAARRVLETHPQVRFFLFGEGPLLASLQAQAAELNLGDRFVFGGFVRDVSRVLSAFDISVFPSLWEGTPLTVFEAMAAGKPIAATDADGLIEVLEHERTALIVPRRDGDALAAAIVRLIDDPSLRGRLAAGAAGASRQFDIATFVSKMERLYDILAQSSRATRRDIVGTTDLSFLTGDAAS